VNIFRLLVETALHTVRRQRLAWFRQKTWLQKSGTVMRCLNYQMQITDGPNFYMQYKDEFINRIYHFESVRPDPLIIDGGSNIGMSILYFKHVYPAARIIGFEPDPSIFLILQENITRNDIKNVTLVNAGLSAQPGTTTFVPDGSAGGYVGEGRESVIKVRTEQLSNYLNEPVDFLKLNIEGEELPVLQEAEAGGRLRNVRELVLEYHGWPSGKQQLGAILELLDRQGFRYLIHDFDAESCSGSKPPFHLTSQSTWFCLVYAKRQDDEAEPGRA
jgi:FkbM family methyltransferase